MCKIIGITGHRGTGRKTAAWLLAKTLEECKRGTAFEKYEAMFECWVKLVIIDASEATSTDHVILDSIGDHILDQIKQLCPILIPYDLHDETLTNSVYINPRTFEIVNPCNTPIESCINPRNILTASELFEIASKDHKALSGQSWVVWMSLSEFILYLAHYVMKCFLGPDVWLNIASTTAAIMESSDIRIYWDVKTQAELDYIKRMHGTIIELINPDRAVAGGFRDIEDIDPNFSINSQFGLKHCAEQFWNIARTILN